MARIETYSVFRKERTKVVLTGEDKIEAEKLQSGELRHCPRCNTIIESRLTKCEKCGALIDAATGTVVGIDKISDSELIARIKALEPSAKKKSAKFSIGMKLCPIGFSVGAICCGMEYYVVGILGFIIGVIGLVVALPDLIQRTGATNAIKRDINIAVILPALEQIFENVRYSKDGHIPKEKINEGHLIHSGVWNAISGSDHVTALYKGLAIEFSDILLEQVAEKEEKDGSKTEERETIFKGIWLTCDFGRELTTDLLLLEKREKSKLGKILSKNSNVETENAAFNEKFTIQTKNPHEAFYILTPHMMEFIVQMDDKAMGETRINFSKDGFVHVAINTGRDNFEYDWRTVADNLDGTRQRMISEIRYITDIIDELRLTDSMFKSEHND